MYYVLLPNQFLFFKQPHSLIYCFFGILKSLGNFLIIATIVERQSPNQPVFLRGSNYSSSLTVDSRFKVSTCEMQSKTLERLFTSEENIRFQLALNWLNILVSPYRHINNVLAKITQAFLTLNFPLEWQFPELGIDITLIQNQRVCVSNMIKEKLKANCIPLLEDLDVINIIELHNFLCFTE